MKKGKNSLIKKIFSKDKVEKGRKQVDSLKSNSYNDTMKELDRMLAETQQENKELQELFWNELSLNMTLTQLKDKVAEGEQPNELECNLVGVLRI